MLQMSRPYISHNVSFFQKKSRQVGMNCWPKYLNVKSKTHIFLHVRKHLCYQIIIFIHVHHKIEERASSLCKYFFSTAQQGDIF